GARRDRGGVPEARARPRRPPDARRRGAHYGARAGDRGGRGLRRPRRQHPDRVRQSARRPPAERRACHRPAHPPYALLGAPRGLLAPRQAVPGRTPKRCLTDRSFRMDTCVLWLFGGHGLFFILAGLMAYKSELIRTGVTELARRPYKSPWLGLYARLLSRFM